MPYSHFSPTTRSRVMRRHSLPIVIAASVLVQLPSTALAQETYATLIENEASATIQTAPTTVIFQLSRRFVGDSLAGAVRSAQTFAPGLRSALKEVGYERADLRVTGPMIPSATAKSIRIDAELRLALTSTGEEGTRSTAFATAADKVAEIAAEFECDVDGPVLDVGDRSELENKAVQRAIENAYTRAQAAATIMRVEIVSVDRVTIESVKWHDRPNAPGQEASADRIGVTVNIRVAYLALPPGS